MALERVEWSKKIVLDDKEKELADVRPDIREHLLALWSVVESLSAEDLDWLEFDAGQLSEECHRRLNYPDYFKNTNS